MKPSEERVFAALKRAADAGAPCPGNAELIEVMGCKSISGPSSLISRLEARGVIRVLRFNQSRQVTIVATGKSTALPAGTHAPHWSDRMGRPPARVKVKRETAPAPVEVDRPRVCRDPCPRCGVRRDVGCEHSGARLSMGAFA